MKPLSEQVEAILRDAPSAERAWGAMIEENIVAKIKALESKSNIEALIVELEAHHFTSPESQQAIKWLKEYAAPKCRYCGNPISMQFGKWNHDGSPYWCWDSTGTRRAPKP